MPREGGVLRDLGDLHGMVAVATCQVVGDLDGDAHPGTTRNALVGVPAFAAGEHHRLGDRLGFLCSDDRVHRIDGVLGHLAVGGQLAAGHRNDAALAGRHRVTPGKVCGLGVLRRLDQRPYAGPRPGHVFETDLGREPGVHRIDQVLSVFFGANNVLDRTGVVGVGRPKKDVLAPRNHEDEALLSRYRNDACPPGDHFVGCDRDVHSLCGAYRIGIDAFVHRPDLVGPNSRSVDDARRSHRDDIAGFGVANRRSGDPIGRADTFDADHLGVVGDGCTVGLGRRPQNGQDQPGVIDAGVVKLKTCREQGRVEVGEVLKDLVGCDLFVELPDTRRSGQVVSPEGGIDATGKCFRCSHPTRTFARREDRVDEWLEKHEVRRNLEEPGALGKGLVHEAKLALFEVAKTSVDKFGTLR